MALPQKKRLYTTRMSSSTVPSFSGACHDEAPGTLALSNAVGMVNTFMEAREERRSKRAKEVMQARKGMRLLLLLLATEPIRSSAVYQRDPLDPWTRMGISQQVVDAALGSVACEGAFKVQYLSGQLYTCAPAPNTSKGFPHTLFYKRYKHVLKVLDAAIRSNGPAVGDWEGVFCLGDCVASQLVFAKERHIGTVLPLFPDPVAAFTPVACPGSMNIPFPMWENNGYDRWDTWDNYTQNIRLHGNAWPWNKRVNAAVFRGAHRTCTLYPSDLGLQTIHAERFRGVDLNQPEVARQFDSHGIPATVARTHHEASVCSRSAIVWRSGQSPLRSRFNVSLKGGYWNVYGEQGSQGQYAASGFANDSPKFMSMADMQAFRYIIWGEGNCGYAHRLRMMLHMGTVIIMPHDPEACIEAYALRLKPYHHFVPVDRTYSNLTDAIRWLDANPKAVESIRRNALQYGKQHVSQAGVALFVRRLLSEYSKLLTYRVTRCPVTASKPLDKWVPHAGWTFSEQAARCRAYKGLEKHLCHDLPVVPSWTPAISRKTTLLKHKRTHRQRSS